MYSLGDLRVLGGLFIMLEVIRSPFCSRGRDHARIQFPIRDPAVAATVAAFELGVEVVDGVFVGKVARLFQIGEQVVALLVYVWRDVMRDLARRGVEADTLSVRCRADPNR